ncbi:MAG: apolipoprotein N-acyltransferase [Bdellovibrionales bacterium RIFOXYD12_FULL_39_22]|nr:MAG: apolipoprotein N-acyltransferase [Bdellovibrionales bacterium RIFOXYB1_FULL_39_21]OFZ45285.1 MAG: apolipoprotein N-acyltransferase [Bdellovibrionales bacterium RIFOXYC12_FULL_39_17]OFZ45525.1 MAG: apolipoprotein N-acyltransferase [Bdellovibrionales bacterium RIFOXYC1_FULL_39_130]OFZ77386.1 MAG: apolipoprotein N-acyltransferase [Bdellovibrionales bacterium RIFOXYD1_FULL_39_84]OFZ91515.1 MAG: apolipoprotein N-acyltransferase [Bdellovibrionales bacterium RIFOXYD12_FULL_39_22]HLE12028.1 ap
MKIVKYLNVISAPLLSAAFFYAGWAPSKSIFINFAFVPLFYYWSGLRTFRQIIFSAAIFSFFTSLFSAHWIIQGVINYAQTSWVVGAVFLIFFALINNYHIILAAGLWKLLNIRPSNSIASFSVLILLYSTLEILPTIFPGQVGVAWLVNEIPSFFLAKYIGIEGISAIILFCNFFLLKIFTTPIQAQKRQYSVSLLLLLLVAYLGGSFIGGNDRKLAVLPNSTNGESIEILLVQPNISNPDKINEQQSITKRKIMKTLIELTKAGMAAAAEQNRKIDLIIWPETAVPEVFNQQHLGGIYQKEVLDLVKESKSPLITGAYFEEKDGLFSNAVFLLLPSGEISKYRKNSLLPGGESNTFLAKLPWIGEKFKFAASLVASNDPSQIALGQTLNLEISICYEGILKRYNSENFIIPAIAINVANDLWFGDYFEPTQHAFITLAKSIEANRSMARVANSGISFVYDSIQNTTSVMRSNMASTALVSLKTPHANAESFYVKNKWILITLKLLFIVGIFLFFKFRPKYSS